MNLLFKSKLANKDVHCTACVANCTTQYLET